MNRSTPLLTRETLALLFLSGALAGMLVLAAAAGAATRPTTITFTEVSKGSTFEFVDNPPKQVGDRRMIYVPTC